MLALHQNFPYKARLKKYFRYFSVWGGGPLGSHFTSKTIVNVKDLTKTDAIQKNPKNAFQSHANIPFETDGQKAVGRNESSRNSCETRRKTNGKF